FGYSATMALYCWMAALRSPSTTSFFLAASIAKRAGAVCAAERNVMVVRRARMIDINFVRNLISLNLLAHEIRERVCGAIQSKCHGCVRFTHRIGTPCRGYSGNTSAAKVQSRVCG